MFIRDEYYPIPWFCDDHVYGETLWSPPNSTSEESEAYVNLVSSVTIPGFKGSYAVGKVNGERSEEVLFEPCCLTFNDLGVDVQEELLSVGSDGSSSSI